MRTSTVVAASHSRRRTPPLPPFDAMRRELQRRAMRTAGSPAFATAHRCSPSIATDRHRSPWLAIDRHGSP
jgi:hypothetical protein